MIEEGTALIEDDLEDNPGTNDIIVNNDTTHDVEPGIPNELIGYEALNYQTNDI